MYIIATDAWTTDSLPDIYAQKRKRNAKSPTRRRRRTRKRPNPAPSSRLTLHAFLSHPSSHPDPTQQETSSRTKTPLAPPTPSPVSTPVSGTMLSSTTTAKPRKSIAKPANTPRPSSSSQAQHSSPSRRESRTASARYLAIRGWRAGMG